MAKSKKNISFEDSLQRLEEISNLMDESEISLQDLVKLYKEGLDLACYCSEFLNKVEQEVVLLKKNTQHKFELDNFDVTKI